MYTYGRGTIQDFYRAISLFELGSRFNHAPSIYYMGLFKFNGYGCEIDYNQAVNWLERAAGNNMYILLFYFLYRYQF